MEKADLNALMIAVRNNDTETVHTLLASGVDPSKNHNIALRMAALYGQTEIVKMLLADPRVDVTDRDNDAIHKAEAAGHWEIVDLLMSRISG